MALLSYTASSLGNPVASFSWLGFDPLKSVKKSMLQWDLKSNSDLQSCKKTKIEKFTSIEQTQMRLTALCREDLQNQTSMFSRFMTSKSGSNFIQQQKALQEIRYRTFKNNSLVKNNNEQTSMNLQKLWDTFQNKTSLDYPNLTEKQLFDLWTGTLSYHFIRVLKDNVHIQKNHQKKILFCFPPKSGSSSWHLVGDSILNNRSTKYEKTLFNSVILYDSINMPRIRQMIPKCNSFNISVTSQCNPFRKLGRVYPRKKFRQIFLDDAEFSENFVKTDDIILEDKQATQILKYLNNLLNSEDVLRVIHTRHPFVRLYSAWTDKFFLYREMSKIDKSKYSADTIKYHDVGTFRGYKKIWQLASKYDKRHPTTTNLTQGAQVSFSAFVKFLLKDGGFSNNFNKHWMPMSLLCGANQIKYNFFSQLETIDSDFKYFKYLADFGYLDDFPKARFSSVTDKDRDTNNNNNDRYLDKYVKIYKESISLEERVQLYDVYKQDFEMFGYEYEPFLR